MNKKVLHTIIDHIAEIHSDRVAIEEENRKITYSELTAYSNRIAHTLIEEGIQRGSVVGIYLSSGVNYIGSILGTNKAGGIFMPLELSYPAKRLSYLLEKAAPSILITTPKLLNDLFHIYKESPNISLDKIIILHDQNDKIEVADVEGFELINKRAGSHSEDKVEFEVDGDDSNYLIYTSGSTGLPKIIEGCHKSLSHFIHWEKNEFGFDEHIKVSQLVPISFDPSLRDIFVPLICGGCLCIPNKETKENILSLIKWIGESKITLIHTVPSLFRQLTRTLQGHPSLKNEIESLTYLLLSGEALYGRDVVDWQETVGIDNVNIVNLYGPSETTLAKTYHRVEHIIQDKLAILPIGQPISNTIAIITRNNNLCEVGDIGEIYIKTPFRSKGYYKDEALTAERFIQNPLHNEYEDIVYKTGDIGRYLEDRSIEFIGREDGQVKIRGNRVELSEIEKVLKGYSAIAEVVITTIKKSEGEDVIACYYIENSPIEETILRNYISEYLPDYMHPSYYVCLEEFPLNLNGKIDKRALPRPEELLYEKLTYESPADELEERIAQIWAEVLGLKKVGVLNSFFELGGHSLAATRVVSRLFMKTGKQVSLRDFFEFSTVRLLANLLKQKDEKSYKAIESISEQPYYDLSHAQKRLWILDQMYGSIPYHMSGGVRVAFTLEKDIINQVLILLIDRHESLRTTFEVIKGEPKQIIHPVGSMKSPVIFHDLQFSKNVNTDLSQLVNEERTMPFDLVNGPLIRARFIKLNEQSCFLMISLHHIISDGWSCKLAIHEILTLYNSIAQDQPNPLEPLRIQYKDYAAWQNKMLHSDELQSQRLYWTNRFSGVLPKLNLPTDYTRPTHRTFEGATYRFTISEADSDALRNICLEYNVTIFMLTLAIVNVLLYKLSGQREIIVGSPIAGRNNPDLESQIGFYLNNLVLKNQINRKQSFHEFLEEVKKVTLEAYENQDYPYDKLVEDLKLDLKDNANPIYDVLFVMNNTELSGRKEESSSEGIEEFPMEEETSKLDLSFFIEDKQELSFVIEYSTALFKHSSIVNIQDSIVTMIKLIIENTTISIGDIINSSEKINEELLGSTMNSISENF